MATKVISFSSCFCSWSCCNRIRSCMAKSSSLCKRRGT
ncbi:hypothetical protein GM526_15935 [Enterococcus avium]|nr:hypothetical protein [Enterococcus avium]